MKLSLIIEAINRGATRTVEGVGKSMRGLGRASRETSGDLKKVDREMAATERSATRLSRAAHGVGFALGSAARKGVIALGQLEAKTKLSEEGMRRLAGMGGRLLGTGAAIAGGAILGLATGGIYKIVSAGMEFEKYRTQLTGLMGSVAAGNKAMDWVTKFARETPYEVAQVMEAFIRLKAYGIDPTDGSLRTLGDTAGGMGKDLMQAVEMIADAQTGEFERLKEFGIKAKQKGDDVTFNFMRNGKSMTRHAKKTGQDITKVLFDIFNGQFAGGMDRLSQTTEGKWSNVMDRMTINAKRVWEGGFGSSVNRQLDRFSAWIDKLEADGSLSKWAESTGKSMGDFIGKMGSADWAGMGRDVSTLAGAVRDLAGALAWLNSADSAPARALNGVAGAADRAGRSSHDAVQGMGMPDWSGMKAPRAPVSPDAPWYEHDIFDFSWLRGSKPTRPASPARPAAPATPRPSAPAGHAKISLEVRSARDLTVTPTRVAAQGVNVELNTGRAWQGAA
ncbi:tape measure protein [Sphingomonas sp. AR_OL41]|uniref:tape measure protein n=1 Tax=Sphingomonas sp. AR_OL41 TaxID=3042729 RepID=UPI002480D60D|nr:tape measure protein [Sphingomonas sp. AR_OL41]MDH7971787.1 tape measure protein [Sphingomonas sp. AR_OL41]